MSAILHYLEGMETYLLPDSGLHDHRMQLGIGLLELGVHTLAFVAVSYVLLYVVSHILPEEPAANLLNSLVTTHMPPCIHVK